MTPERRRAIAAMGGVAAAKSGKAHRFTHEEAVRAGRKGGRAKKRAEEDGDHEGEEIDGEES